MKKLYKNLINGSFGLSKTFWIYNFLIGNILNILFIPLYLNPISTIIAIVISIYYQAVVIIGIWRAGSQYNGWKGWVLLSRLIIILGIVFSLFTIVINYR